MNLKLSLFSKLIHISYYNIHFLEENLYCSCEKQTFQYFSPRKLRKQVLFASPMISDNASLHKHSSLISMALKSNHKIQDPGYLFPLYKT